MSSSLVPVFEKFLKPLKIRKDISYINMYIVASAFPNNFDFLTINLVIW